MGSLIYLSTFLIGMLFGASMFMGYGLYQVRKLRKVKKTLWEEVKKKTAEMEQKTQSIRERLIKASQIAQAQMELRAQAEMPSKNALHSEYKNGLAVEIAEMEQQKLDILRTVLAEGFDPMITVVHDGGTKEEIPLSNYINTAQQTADAFLGKKQEEPQAPPPDAGQPKKVGKFFVYKGGKDDGTTH